MVEEKCDLKISIITVTFNSKLTLERTIKSVISQTYSNIEYIIIDGGSEDGTLEIIRNYEKCITYWISEKDFGIYDAMNKGINRATGDYIYFLNSDDYLINNGTIEDVVRLMSANKSIDVFSFGVLFHDPLYNLTGKIRIKTSNISRSLRSGFMFPHQGIFMKRDLILRLNGFNEKYKIAADFDLLVRADKLGAKFNIIDKEIAVFEVGGVSNSNKKNAFKSVFEKREIICKQYGKMTCISNFIFFLTSILRVEVKFLLIKTNLIKYWRRFKGWKEKVIFDSMK